MSAFLIFLFYAAKCFETNFHALVLCFTYQDKGDEHMPSVGTSWRRRNPSFVLFVLSAFSVPCSVCVPHSTVNSSTQQAECVFCGRSVFCGLRGEYTGKNQLSRFEHPLPWMLRQTGSLRSPRPTWRIDIPRFPCLFGKTSPSKPCVVHWSEAETVEKNNYPKKVRRKKAS